MTRDVQVHRVLNACDDLALVTCVRVRLQYRVSATSAHPPVYFGRKMAAVSAGATVQLQRLVRELELPRHHVQTRLKMHAAAGQQIFPP